MQPGAYGEHSLPEDQAQALMNGCSNSNHPIDSQASLTANRNLFVHQFQVVDYSKIGMSIASRTTREAMILA
jgi:hypothetical protein